MSLIVGHVYHSHEIRSLAGQVLNDPFATKREKALAASILGGSGHEMRTTSTLPSGFGLGKSQPAQQSDLSTLLDWILKQSTTNQSGR